MGARGQDRLWSFCPDQLRGRTEADGAWGIPCWEGGLSRLPWCQAASPTLQPDSVLVRCCSCARRNTASLWTPLFHAATAAHRPGSQALQEQPWFAAAPISGREASLGCPLCLADQAQPHSVLCVSLRLPFISAELHPCSKCQRCSDKGARDVRFPGIPLARPWKATPRGAPLDTWGGDVWLVSPRIWVRGVPGLAQRVL